MGDGGADAGDAGTGDGGVDAGLTMGAAVLQAATPPQCTTEFPVSCSDHECCAVDTECSGTSCVSCGRTAPLLCGTVCCHADTACTSAGCAACPADHPSGCQDACCLAGGCNAGVTCGCPNDMVSCEGPAGLTCCSAGDVCGPGGSCLSCASGQTPCAGESDAGVPSVCCAAGDTCSGTGACCPSDHPVSCNGKCCLPGSSCTPTGCTR
jgi:hypothetical protein